MKPKLLDLFCGAGGAAMGYYRAGFEVVGVDIKPQPHYPFEFHQADALTYPLEGFDAYHASPPCQAYSTSISPVVGFRKEHPKLIEPIRSILNQTCKPFVIENVPNSPLAEFIKLDGTMFGLKTRKERWFELHGFQIYFSPVPFNKGKGYIKKGLLIGVCQYHAKNPLEINPNRQNLEIATGIDWGMNRHELRQAIPPAYTEYIGKYLLQALHPSEAVLS